ncbi:MAG: DUF2157 domain-containing protein [Planctomycetota bacterium]|nr:MAG: DUF2157 domain-containing protein [Planctomycetota bacterium]
MARKLDGPADRKTIQALYKERIISYWACKAALSMLQGPRLWLRWINRMLLILGAALCLAGVVFFFAFNWAAMSAFLKFTLIEVSLAACLIGAWFAGIDRLVGKLLLLGASVFTGVFLAVYGQVYQTGADPWELFFGWSLLIIGWVAISRFAALWVLWLAILNTGIILYWAQVAIPNDSLDFGSLCIVLGIINGAAFILREWGSGRGMKWLRVKWLQHLLFVVALAFPTIGTIAVVVDESHYHFPGVLVPVLWMFYIAFAYWFFKFKKANLSALALCVLYVCSVALTLAGRILFEISDDALMFLIFGFIVLVVVGVAAWWLLDTHRKMRKAS